MNLSIDQSIFRFNPYHPYFHISKSLYYGEHLSHKLLKPVLWCYTLVLILSYNYKLSLIAERHQNSVRKVSYLRWFWILHTDVQILRVLHFSTFARYFCIKPQLSTKVCVFFKQLVEIRRSYEILFVKDDKNSSLLLGLPSNLDFTRHWQYFTCNSYVDSFPLFLRYVYSRYSYFSHLCYIFSYGLLWMFLLVFLFVLGS